MYYRFYWILFIVLGLALPIYMAVQYWDESWKYSLLVIGPARLMITTHIAWLMNSALLVWGLKKGDRLMFGFYNVLRYYKLLTNIPKSHATIVIDRDGIYCM